MGGCMDKPREIKVKAPGQIKKSQSTKPNKSKIKTIEQSDKHSTIVQPPKYKKMTVNELLITYRIECTLQMSSKMEGPKYLSNIVDGSSKVLRIISQSEIDEKRLQIYKQVVGFEVYENDQGTLMILDEFCSGEDLHDLTDKYKEVKEQGAEKQLLKFLETIFTIITQFHRHKIWLGNLNLGSFKKVSPYREEIQLVDFNLTGHTLDLEKMGFAHKESFEADYEFLGYLVQFLLSEQPPIFIPHKMQYVQFQKIPHQNMIMNLLKGRKCQQNEIKQLNPALVKINERASLGYRLRRDINKLLKMRRKRKGHNRKFYGDDTATLITDTKFNEDAVYRYEAERIFDRIGTYVGRLRSIHEEAFLNYAGNNEGLRRLKQVFLLVEGEKKMAELKQCLATIK